MCETFSEAPGAIKMALMPMLARMPFPNMIVCCGELESQGYDQRVRSNVRRWVSENCLQCEICQADFGTA